MAARRAYSYGIHSQKGGHAPFAGLGISILAMEENHMKMKNFVALALAGCMALSLAACGSTATTGETSEAATGEQAADAMTG